VQDGLSSVKLFVSFSSRSRNSRHKFFYNGLPEISVESCMHPLCLHPLWVMKSVWLMTACHSHSGIMKLVVPTVSDCHEVMTGLILVMLLLVLLELTEWLTFQVLLWSFV
jgi:hypothetical protein